METLQQYSNYNCITGPVQLQHTVMVDSPSHHCLLHCHCYNPKLLPIIGNTRLPFTEVFSGEHISEQLPPSSSEHTITDLFHTISIIVHLSLVTTYTARYLAHSLTLAIMSLLPLV